MSDTRWPTGHEPPGADVHVVNTGRSRAAPDEVWSWLVRPDRWSTYYGNARRVRHRSGTWPEVTLGTRFSWVTFGAPVTTEVTDLERPSRLGWTGTGLGARGHHLWVLERTDDGGTVIRTEETQRGTAVRLLGPVLVPTMRRQHQRWVDGLSRVAERGRS
ncbi:MAG: SRPBCC domain-containing protein [Phycicoccus sp.]